MIFFLKLTRPD